MEDLLWKDYFQQCTSYCIHAFNDINDNIIINTATIISFYFSLFLFFRFPSVIGIGTFDGKLEIHTFGEKEHDVKIKSLLESNKYKREYSIVHFKKRPRFLARPVIKSGDQLDFAFCSRGTLGCFLQDNERKVYVLTAAHVFQPSKNNVTLNDKTCLGKFRDMLSGLHHMDYLNDFALIFVKQGLSGRLWTELMDHEGNRRNTILMIHPRYIRKDSPVYKHGNKTGLTYGKLTSTDYKGNGYYPPYVVKGLNEENQGPFAKQGDSGSIICQYHEDHGVVLAISMLTQGHCRRKNKYFSIPLIDIVQKLQKKTGKRFWLCD